MFNETLRTLHFQYSRFVSTKLVSKLVLALVAFTIAVSLFNTSIDQVYLKNDYSVLGYLDKEANVTQKYPLIHHSNERTPLDFIDYDREHIKYIYPEVIQTIYNNTDLDAVDWSKYAYVLYATSSSHMCNALMICAELRKFKTRAELVLLVKKEFLTDREKYEYEYKTLTNFAYDYNVTLKPTEVIQRGGDDVNIWLSSFTKLMVFNQTSYERIIYMDSDALLTQGNLDELFFIPPCKMAVSTAYWNTHITYEKTGPEKLQETYDQQNTFKPMTTRQRNKKVNQFIDTNITPFINEKTNKLTFKSGSENQNYSIINKKNFYTNIYNELPNYVALDEFGLTNIVMVIQPSAELFELVLKSIDEKQKGQYDMELVQYHLFDVRKIPAKQKLQSLKENPNLTYDERITEIPEFLILPHQIYGTITPELNSVKNHNTHTADAHEQVFAFLNKKTSNHEPAYYQINDLFTYPGDYIYKNVKYLHFSDAPIPKPWFYQNPKADYMSYRTRCPSFRDFNKEGIVKPAHETNDCSAGKNWEKAHSIFKDIRKEVCGLDLIVTDKETYHGVIN